MYDLSPPITEQLAVWPGDNPMSREYVLRQSRGDTVTLSTLRATGHLGSHADGPNHYLPGAEGIGEQSLEHYLGVCQVIPVRADPGVRYDHTALPADVTIEAPRVLLATGVTSDPTIFDETFPAPDPGLIDFLADRGVITLGVDTPSVDLFSSKDLPTHHRCGDRGLLILEGLQLGPVPPGRYELVALPLRLMGFDGSPVRAILRPLPTEMP